MEPGNAAAGASRFSFARLGKQLRHYATVFRDPAAEALATLRGHKLRSALTLLGVTLSVAVLIFVVSIITGANLYIQNRVANLGSNVFLVLRFPIITNQQDFFKAMKRNKNISWEDFEAVRDGMRRAKSVGLEVRTSGKVRGDTQALDDINVRGVTANIADMDVEEPETGRYITDADNENRADVTFIGQEVAGKLFPTVDPIGKTILIDGQGFQVVGVAKPIGTVFGQSQDDFVYVPVRTFLKRYGEHGQNLDLAINIQARGAEWMQETKDEARTIMRGRRHLDPNEDDNFGILASDTIMSLWKNLTGAIAATMVGVVSVFSGDWRRGDHERDVGQRYRADARSGSAQIDGRDETGHPDAVPGGVGGDGGGGRRNGNWHCISFVDAGENVYAGAIASAGGVGYFGAGGFYGGGIVFRDLSGEPGGEAGSD